MHSRLCTIAMLTMLGLPSCATSPSAEQSSASSQAQEETLPAPAPGNNDCQIAREGDSPMVKACAEGGVDRAKQVMKALLKQGRTAGLRLDCSDCHGDELGYATLTADARTRLEQLMLAVGKR